MLLSHKQNACIGLNSGQLELDLLLAMLAAEPCHQELGSWCCSFSRTMTLVLPLSSEMRKDLLCFILHHDRRSFFVPLCFQR